ncbi:hypothetical protein R6Q59_004620 [Mikania micrantha]
MNILFTLLILSSLIPSIIRACLITSKWDVFIMSSITDDIIAHIKSGDDDLGNHTIPFNGNYIWSFCDRFDGHTLFYGYFWWGSKSQSLALFDDKLRKPCYQQKRSTQHCYWLVRPDGFFVSAYNRSFSDDNWEFKKAWS